MKYPIKASGDNIMGIVESTEARLARYYGGARALYHLAGGGEFDIRDLPKLVVGKGTRFNCLDGRSRPIVDFDYTATKPLIWPVIIAYVKSAFWRQNAHRAPSPKSLVTTANYERAREIVRRFMGAEHPAYEAAFQQNATHAINTLSHMLKQYFAGSERNLVLVSTTSHHSNLLPFLESWDTRWIEIKEDGTIDMEQYQRLLGEVGPKVALVTTELVSNVTGFIQPIRTMAKLAHQHGALISVDNAQGAASLPFRMWTGDPADSVDFLDLSGHKIYGPEGTGVLIGRKEFLNGTPLMPGGGTAKGITKEVRYYAEFPHHAEAGSQNHAGQIGMAVAMEVLMEIGLENIQREELARANYAMQKMQQVKGIKILGENDFSKVNRLGVIAFNLYDGEDRPIPAALVGAILAWQFALGIRTGCFCAGPYMQELQGISIEAANEFAERVHTKQDRDVPYFCRASFSVDKSYADIDYLIYALTHIRDNIDIYKKMFEFDEADGVYKPKGKRVNYLEVFNAFKRFAA